MFLFCFYVIKQTNNFFYMFFANFPENFRIIFHFLSICVFQTVNSYHLASAVNIGAPHNLCSGGQVADDQVPGQLCASGSYGGGPRRRQGEPTSSFNYESSPGQILSSL